MFMDHKPPVFVRINVVYSTEDGGFCQMLLRHIKTDLIFASVRPAEFVKNSDGCLRQARSATPEW